MCIRDRNSIHGSASRQPLQLLRSKSGREHHTGIHLSLIHILLDVTILEPFTVLDVPSLSFQLFNKTIDQNSRIKTFRCQTPVSYTHLLGSNELGLTQEEVEQMSPATLTARKAEVRQRMLLAGAHYVVDSIEELPKIIELINHKLNTNH